MPHDKTLLALTVLVSLAFAWVLWPLYGAVFWAVTLAIVLDPLARRAKDLMGGRKNMAALVMVLGIVLLIILPTLSIIAAIVQEADSLIRAVQSGEIDVRSRFQGLIDAAPAWSKGALDWLKLSDLSNLQAGALTRIGDWLAANVPTVLSLGQNTLGFFVGMGVMLYLTFFLFRDGERLLARIKSAIPIERRAQEELLSTFTVVVRATVRGDILVALLQGCLGGLGFWFLGIHAVVLWVALMSFLSLFPVFGAALVWLPMAIYLLASGMIWQGVGLIVYGVLVVSLIDNIVRPWLVGQATRMPDYIVMISTIGGIATFGMQGFIIGPVVAAMFIAVWTSFSTER